MRRKCSEQDGQDIQDGNFLYFEVAYPVYPVRQGRWVGFVPFEEPPSAQNPSGDFFASANNRPARPDYPHFLSHYYQPPYRVALIGDTLRAAHDLTADHPLGSIAPLRPIFNREPYPIGGN